LCAAGGYLEFGECAACPADSQGSPKSEKEVSLGLAATCSNKFLKIVPAIF
jgi:hypothetical protein